MSPNGYLWRAGEALDQFLNVVLLDGTVGETISHHAAEAQVRKRIWGCLLCRWLSWTVEPDHCPKTIQGHAISPRGGLMAGLQLLLVFLLITGSFWAVFFH